MIMKYEKPKIIISQVATKIFENKIKPMPRFAFYQASERDYKKIDE